MARLGEGAVPTTTLFIGTFLAALLELVVPKLNLNILMKGGREGAPGLKSSWCGLAPAPPEGCGWGLRPAGGGDPGGGATHHQRRRAARTLWPLGALVHSRVSVWGKGSIMCIHDPVKVFGIIC